MSLKFISTNDMLYTILILCLKNGPLATIVEYIFFKDLFIYLTWVHCGCLQTHQKRASDLSTDGCEPPCGCWELNSGPLEEQSVLLTTEPSLQPLEGSIFLKQCCSAVTEAWAKIWTLGSASFLISLSFPFSYVYHDDTDFALQRWNMFMSTRCHRTNIISTP